MKTQKTKITSTIIDLFRGLRVFSTEFFLVYGSIFGSTVTHTSQKYEELPLACLFEVFTGLWLSTPTFCTKVIIMLNILSVCWCISDKYRASQTVSKKMENTTLLISSSIYAKRHINVCSGGDLCSPSFSNFSETPCMEAGFDVRISLA